MSTEVPVIGSENTSLSTLLSVPTIESDLSLPLIGSVITSQSTLFPVSSNGGFSLPLTGSETSSSSLLSTPTSEGNLSLHLVGTATSSSSKLFSTSNKCLDLILQMYLEDSMLTGGTSLKYLSCHPKCPRGSTIHVHQSGNKVEVYGLGSISALFVNKIFYRTLSPFVYSRMELFCRLSESGPEHHDPDHDDSENDDSEHDNTEHDGNKYQRLEHNDPGRNGPAQVSIYEIVGALRGIPNLQRHVRHVEFTVPLLHTLYYVLTWRIVGRYLEAPRNSYESQNCLGVVMFAKYFKKFNKLDEFKVVVEHSGVGHGRNGEGALPRLSWLLPLWDMPRVIMLPVSLHFLSSVDDAGDIAKKKLREAWRICQNREEERPTLKLGLSSFSLTKLTFKDKWSWSIIVEWSRAFRAERISRGTYG